MKLETKLGMSSGALILAMLLSAFVATWRIRQVNHLTTILTQHRIPTVDRALALRFSLMHSVRDLESYMLFGIDPETSIKLRAQRLASFESAERAAAELLTLSSGLNLGEQAIQVQQIQSQINQLRTDEKEVERLNQLRTPEGTSQAYDLLNSRILPLDATLFTSLDAFVGAQKAQSRLEINQLNEANRDVILSGWSATVLGAILGGIFATVIGKRVTRGVDMVAERANAIASGDLTGAPLAIDSSDQIGSLADAMQQMQESLARIIGTVAETAGTLTASAVTMRSASDQVHRRVDEQTQQTQQTATAMQEMSASIAEVSRHTQSAVESARSAAQTAREGGAIVKQMLGCMSSISAGFSETRTTVGLLGEDSRRISQIVTVISDIARKTNLLALNAAIEAARAGEQGRGFAVVAGEVRHLAESTAQATSEISAMIQAVQSRTLTAIDSMNGGSATVELGVSTTHRAGDALEGIIGMAERVERMITQIAIAAGQQSAAADQSSYALDSIHTLSNENLAELATTAAGIDSLHRTARKLERKVERFRLAAHTDIPPDSDRHAAPRRPLRTSLTTA
jgi:methyl-accepting chemotaxis protein